MHNRSIEADTSYKQMPKKFLKIRNSIFLKALPLLNSTRRAIFLRLGDYCGNYFINFIKHAL
jgi:hypothetical protein